MNNNDNKKNFDENPELYPLKRGFLGTIIFKFALFLCRHLLNFQYLGKENLPKDAPFVLAANHQTFVDGLWIAGALPKAQQKITATIAGSDLLTDFGVWGRLICRVGRAIPLNRNGNAIRGLILAKKKLCEGYILIIHPEGTRSSDGKIAPLHEGASYLSMKGKAPLIPVYICGGYDIFSRHKTFPNFRDKVTHKKKNLSLIFGTPLLPKDYKNSKDLHKALEIALAKLEEKYIHFQP